MSDNQLIRVTPPSPGVRGEICIGETCFTWPDPSCGFKPQIIGWKRPVFPCVMLGGNWGRQLIFEQENGQTYFENDAPVAWFSPETGMYPFAGGEEVVEGFEDRRVRSIAIKYNLMVAYGLIPGTGVNIPAAEFHLNDLYMDAEATAFSRSVYMSNLPAPQPSGVTVAKIFQANSVETFNTYLKQFQAEGWKGAWARPNNAVWTDTEYFVSEPLVKRGP
jgi:hypothetical protein